MPQYRYTAKQADGQTVSDTLSAETELVVASMLRTTGLTPMSIVAAKQRQRAAIRPMMKKAELAVFTRQMADLLKSSVGIDRALATLTDEFSSERAKLVLESLQRSVTDGEPLSQGMRKLPHVFPDFHISLTEAGEYSGRLPESLKRSADDLEKLLEMRSKVAGACVYPVFLALAGAITILAMLAFVIPRFVALFDTLEQDLPWATQALISASSFMQSYWWLIGVVGVCAGLLVVRTAKTPAGRLFIDTLLLKIPIMGDVAAKTSVATFARMLSSLLEQGVTLLKALAITAKAVPNQAFAHAIQAMTDDVEKGTDLATAMRSTNLFPTMANSIVAVGAESGNLEGVLGDLSESYENQVDRTLKTALAMMEPIMIFILGGCVAFIVAAVLLPIFEIDVFSQ